MEKKKVIVYIIRISLVLLTAYMLYHKEFLFAFGGLIAALLAFSPELIGKNYQISFPFTIEFLIAFALLLNIYGGWVGWYKSVSFFSSLMHFLGTAIIALLALIFVYALNQTRHVRVSEFMMGFFTVIFALAIGAVWEIGEFLFDVTMGTNFQGDYNLNPIADTMNDLIWDGIAGLFVAIIGTSTYIIKKRNWTKPFKDLIRRMIEKGRNTKKIIK